jgi:hypothetical protein
MSLTFDDRKIRGTASEPDWIRIYLVRWIRIQKSVNFEDLQGSLRINTAKVWKTYREILVQRVRRPSGKS